MVTKAEGSWHEGCSNVKAKAMRKSKKEGR
jgi:hypothetical protein